MWLGKWPYPPSVMTPRSNCVTHACYGVTPLPRLALKLGIDHMAGKQQMYWQQATSRLVRSTSGQSLVELAIAIPIMVLLLAYAVDYGYFFIAEAAITSATRNAVEYAGAGYQSPGQATLPAAGPDTTANTVSSEAIAGLATFNTSSTTTSVQVCSKSNGISNNVAKCTNYGPTATAYTPSTDPEAPHFVLQRVDITYTVQPPIPLAFFKLSLLPNLTFHRQVSMRALD
jgi:Flp pilus assembly protein TadG